FIWIHLLKECCLMGEKFMFRSKQDIIDSLSINNMTVKKYLESCFEEKVSKFCEKKQLEGEDALLYQYNQEKVTDWLSKKHTHIVNGFLSNETLSSSIRSRYQFSLDGEAFKKKIQIFALQLLADFLPEEALVPLAT